MHAREEFEEPDPTGPPTRDRPPLVRELLLVAGLFLVYKLGRQLASGHTAGAYRNGREVWDLERALHLPGEGAVQSTLLHGDLLVQLANTYYAVVHFPATAAFLIWLYLRRPGHYVWARRALAAVTAAALVLHLAYPLAPPRLLPATGLADTARLFGPSVYGPPEADQLSNQFAAMPSLHFGWSLWCGLVVLVFAPRLWMKLLGLLHPLFTVCAIVATANHWILDAAGGAAVVGAGFGLTYVLAGRRELLIPAKSVPSARAADDADDKETAAARV